MILMSEKNQCALTPIAMHCQVTRERLLSGGCINALPYLPNVRAAARRSNVVQQILGAFNKFVPLLLLAAVTPQVRGIDFSARTR